MSLNAQPLFFTDPQIISVEHHSEARVRAELGFTFAAGASVVPLGVADIPEAAKFYPIAFSANATPIPLAILGFNNRNAFVTGADGSEWLPQHYVPLYVRKYPFLFEENSTTGQLTLCIDAPALAPEGDITGTALFEGGAPTAFTRQALELCTFYQRAYHAARQISDTLTRLQLLNPRTATMKLPDGSETRLEGLAMLDEEKFKALPSRDILFLHQDNSLPTIHYILQSQSNWRRLVELASAPA